MIVKYALDSYWGFLLRDGEDVVAFVVYLKGSTPLLALSEGRGVGNSGDAFITFRGHQIKAAYGTRGRCCISKRADPALGCF
jgi:hypothetical protein